MPNNTAASGGSHGEGTADAATVAGYPNSGTTPMPTGAGTIPYPGTATPMPNDTATVNPYPGGYPGATPMPTDTASATTSYPGGYPGAPSSESGYGQQGAQKVDPEVEANRKKIEELFAERTWSDATGKYNFAGKFVDYTSGKVTLQRAGADQNITLEMKQLSEADQKFIRDGLKAQADQKKRDEQQRIRDLRRRPREREGNYNG
jgi:hypothetical protein